MRWALRYVPMLHPDGDYLLLRAGVVDLYEFFGAAGSPVRDLEESDMLDLAFDLCDAGLWSLCVMGGGGDGCVFVERCRDN